MSEDNQSIRISGSRSVKIGRNDVCTVVGSQQVSVGQRLVIEAGDEIQFRVGRAALTLRKDGSILIEGKDISISASGEVRLKASGEITMKGSKIKEN